MTALPAREGLQAPSNGEVAERPKAHAWKACIRQRIEGSNPSLSASCFQTLLSSGLMSFEERAKARRGWPLRRFALGSEPLLDERDSSSVNDRIRLVMRLTREQWELAGREWPAYSRNEMPGLLRRGT